jgi:putative MATE family efflux protein
MEQAKFLTGSPLRHVTVMTLTASFGLMAIFLVDLVDMIFISMLGRDELAAAVGYAGAILFFTTSFNIGVAIAAGALVARALGAGDEDEARHKATNALVAGGIFACLFAAVVWFNLDPLVRLVGASGNTADLAVSYLAIIVPTLPLLLIGMAGGAVLRAHGDARRAMNATLIGGLVNAVLDPILIFGLNLDLTGAALASAASRGAIAIVTLLPLIRVHAALARPRVTAFSADLPAVAALSFPAILTQLATPVGQGYVTRAMAEFGEDAVAGMAVVARLTPVAFGAIFALSGAVGPIIGQNYGAGRYDRVRLTLRDSLIFIAIAVLVMTSVLFLLRHQIIALFEATGIAADLILLFCGPLALFFFFNGMLFVGNAGFNNLGKPFYSTWLNWGRHTLGTIPFVMLGATLYGAPGALIGQAMGGVVFGLLAMGLVMRVLQAEERCQGRPKRATLFQRQARQIALYFARR